jgi:hypothetical protein
VGLQGAAQGPWKPFLVALGALAMVSACFGLAATAYVALRTSTGRRLDSAASDAVSSPLVLSRLYEGLNWVSVGSVGLSLLLCVTLAVFRRRFDLALGAATVIGGADLTTQILKNDLFTRLDLAPGPNSLPSGHTTGALSIALAAVIVAPSAWRSTGGDRSIHGRSPCRGGVGPGQVAPTIGRHRGNLPLFSVGSGGAVGRCPGQATSSCCRTQRLGPCWRAQGCLHRRGASGVLGGPAGTGVARPRAGYHLPWLYRAGLRRQCCRGRLHSQPSPRVRPGHHCLG